MRYVDPARLPSRRRQADRRYALALALLTAVVLAWVVLIGVTW